MATNRVLQPADLDRLLRSLPRDYALGALGDARLVVSPAGGFVLRVAGTDLDRDAAALVKLTNATRVSLSYHLPWVPFLDALLVEPPAGAHHPDVTVVPGDLLLNVLRDGHQALDKATMDRIFQLLAERRLNPPWSLSGWVNELIDPCIASPAETTWHGAATPT